MGTSFLPPTSAAGNASTSDLLGRHLISWRPLCNGTLTTSTPFLLKLLEPLGWTFERSMPISFSRELAHSMAVMLLELVSAAVAAGVDFIQVREPDLPDLALFRLVTECVELARGSSTAILVNDRLDIALATGADGLHLKERSVASSLIRLYVPEGFLLGRSVHTKGDAVQVEAEGELDYLQFGTVYSSMSKPDTETCGIDALEEMTRAVNLPVLAIGGITVDNSFEVFCAGAAGVAAIGLFADGESPGDADAIGHVIGAVRRAYVRSYAERQ